MDKLFEEGIREKNKQKVKKAINSGTDINAKIGMMGETLLHCYIIEKDIEPAKFLIEMGADINKTSNTGGTPLHSAAGNNDINAVQYLISMGADLNKKSVGFTPLTVAINRGYEKVAEILLDSGADVNADAGKSLELARKKGFSQLVSLLSEGRETYLKQEYKQLIISDKDTPNNFDETSFASFIRYISVVVLNGYRELSLDGYPERNLENIDLLKADGLEAFISSIECRQETFIYGNAHSKILITYRREMPYTIVEHYSGRKELFERLADYTKWGLFEVEKTLGNFKSQEPKTLEAKQNPKQKPFQLSKGGYLILFFFAMCEILFLIDTIMI